MSHSTKSHKKRHIDEDEDDSHLFSLKRNKYLDKLSKDKTLNEEKEKVKERNKYKTDVFSLLNDLEGLSVNAKNIYKSGGKYNKSKKTRKHNMSKKHNKSKKRNKSKKHNKSRKHK